MQTTDTRLSDEEKRTRLVQGVATPLEERVARWERIKEWKRRRKSLAQIMALEAEHSGQPISRERVRTILNSPKPGTVGRPKLPGLLARERELVESIVRWQRRRNEIGNMRAEALLPELKDVRAQIRAEQRRRK